MSAPFSLARAARWFADSGIRQPSGGVARFYRSECQKYKPVSNEITGYTASTYIYLFHVTGEGKWLDRASQTAAFLLEHAWHADLETFAFEYPSPSDEVPYQAYFFDCGIIVRGLMAVWRETRCERLRETAAVASHAMIRDFSRDRYYHPVLMLPSKEPLPEAQQWSRSAGCYQLKAALAWLDVFEATGDEALRDAYFELLELALQTHDSFFPAAETAEEIMDRLHPYCYFLEGLLPALDSTPVRAVFEKGLATVRRRLCDLAPCFARSDVYAQLLRLRMLASNVVTVDEPAAAKEAEALEEFQSANTDRRIDGGFLFARRGDLMSPHVNPVSTAFGLQALEMWRSYTDGGRTDIGKDEWPPCRLLI